MLRCGRAAGMMARRHGIETTAGCMYDHGTDLVGHLGLHSSAGLTSYEEHHFGH